MKQALRLIWSVTVLALLFASTHAESNGRWYALALQGGGDKAAYQAGVLSGLVNGLSADQVGYDVITGVGIGSINGAVLSAHAKGDEKGAASEILNIWKTIKEKDIYQNWSWGGPVRGLLFKPSLYDSSPFRGYLGKIIKSPVRNFQVSATDAATGSMKVWDQKNWFANIDKGHWCFISISRILWAC